MYIRNFEEKTKKQNTRQKTLFYTKTDLKQKWRIHIGTLHFQFYC